ncbi:MAG: preprotein translocase subunit YajC [Acidobacteria bacterium]|nr:preprotein translocase subunit YajC [Acidobacteriota bacterium]
MNTTILLFQGGGGSLVSLLLPFLVIGAIFYFLVIMPQRRQQKELQNMIANLKNGDEIVTNGGVIGKILEIRETSFIIRSADKSNMEIGRSAVIGLRPTVEKK